MPQRESERDKQMIVYAKKTQNRRESKTNTNPHKQTNKTSQNTSGIDENNNNNSDNNTERTVIQSKQGLLRVQAHARSRSHQTSVLTATDSVAKGNQGTWRAN